jgi:hypothetical protein
VAGQPITGSQAHESSAKDELEVYRAVISKW